MIYYQQVIVNKLEDVDIFDDITKAEKKFKSQTVDYPY